MCKTLRTKNFRAPRFSWYSFGDICRPFQPSNLKNLEFHFSQNSPPSNLAMLRCTDQLGQVQTPSNSKLSCTKTFIVLIWGHLYAFPMLISQKPRISFFSKLPTKPSAYAVVHRQPWPCSKPSELKTFVHQDFHGIHLGTFLDLSNPHISKITNFIFSQNSPPSHLVVPWCTDNLGHVQTPPNSKLSYTRNFRVFIWGHL